MLRKFVEKVNVISGLDKFLMLKKLIKDNGGVFMSVKKLYYHDDLKSGTLVGTDQFGNKYYENPFYFVPRNRWVEYNLDRGLEYNASQIPPEWHGWMHHITEYPPTVHKPVHYEWMLPYQENKTGTPDAYTPFNTVAPKIEPWTSSGTKNPRKSLQA